MRNRKVIDALLILSVSCFAQEKHHRSAPEPNAFVVGRMTHFDFGPPSNYYELYLVQTTTNGASIERITLTPPGGSCMQPAQAEDKIATVSQSIRTLLGEKNPCSIPRKDIQHELKRTASLVVPRSNRISSTVLVDNKL
jgi:hypothetical protein